MTSLQSIDHLKTICITEKERLNSIISFLNELESISCCDDSKRSIRVLQGIIPNILESIDNQKRQVEVLEFKKQEIYGDEDLHPYLTADELLRSLTRASGHLYNHVMAGKDKKYGKKIHAIQMLLHECGIKMNNLRAEIRPINATSFLGGAMPCHVPSMTGVMPIGVPIVDSTSIKTWPIVSHEMAHGHLQHKKEDKIEEAYRREFEADFFATIIFGPAYFLSFFSTYGGVPSIARNMFKTKKKIPWDNTHPSLENRFSFCIDVLERHLEYNDDLVRKLRKNLSPLFLYKGKTDPDDGLQKKIMQALLKAFIDRRPFMQKVKSNGFIINEKICNQIIKKLDSGGDLTKTSPTYIFNALFSGCYFDETLDLDEKKINKFVIEELYRSAKGKINCC